MKKYCSIFVLVFLAFSVGSLWADPASMRIVRVGSSDPVGMVFDFTSNEFGGGYMEFYNDTAETWSSVRIITEPVYPELDLGLYSFGGDPDDVFTDSTAWFDDTDMLNILFWTTDSDHYIYPGGHFGIALNDEIFEGGFVSRDPAGAGGWESYRGFGALANAPEPGTYWLVVTGLAALGLVRRFRRR